ncbi:MAG: biotin/lipoyl-binding protein [Bacteroidetes bacterium]|uniref:Biotin/lipoyl-binding protein n=1 Tax=Candidatus Gallipaludibacter merdavium TaxID=2840839 RepID=A0A9D9HUJ8_9BACT|nr:biotin/lipoyl-binding protein [Candidatus Gallipaludibacter merdavium]
MKKYQFTINGSKYDVVVNDVDQDVAEIEVNGTPFTVEIAREKKTINVPLRKQAGKVAAQTITSAPVTTTKSVSIKSPLPGSIMKVLVEVGQRVKRGDVLMTMESMKMENNIMTEYDGVVKAIHVSVGKSVMQDDLLIEIEATDSVASPMEQPTAAPVAQPVAQPAPRASAESIKAPLPGSIMKVLVTPGQRVKRGDVLLTMESMKMENSIMAERDCTIKAVHVEVGKNVMQDDVLVDIE